MHLDPYKLSRRAVLAGSAGVIGLNSSGVSASPVQTNRGGEHDFDFFLGRWNVAHRRLKDRLVGATEWVEFTGTCHAWPTLGGFGNVDDNFVGLPGGPYRAMSIRKFSITSSQWSIWWLDGRAEAVEPPVRGAFSNGNGLFTGKDVFRGKPIDVRFDWTNTRSTAPRWEQAFSPDGGKTWETNWTMDFERVA